MQVLAEEHFLHGDGQVMQDDVSGEIEKSGEHVRHVEELVQVMQLEGQLEHRLLLR